MLRIFNYLEQIFNGPKQDDKQSDMPGLESEKSATDKKKKRKQQEQGLKILAPNQMLSRLPIFFSSIKSKK